MNASWILWLVALAGCGGRLDSNGGEAGAPACPANAQSFGWSLFGANPTLYQGGSDAATTCNGEASTSLGSTEQASSSDFATMMTKEDATTFAGKRVRFRGWVKTEGLDSWAGLWMRVDEPNQKMGAFDNMTNRRIAGTTDWTQYDVVLDVAPDAVDVAFGVLLSGNGHVWLDGVDVEIVDDSVPTTGS